MKVPPTSMPTRMRRCDPRRPARAAGPFGATWAIITPSRTGKDSALATVGLTSTPLMPSHGWLARPRAMSCNA